MPVIVTIVFPDQQPQHHLEMSWKSKFLCPNLNPSESERLEVDSAIYV